MSTGDRELELHVCEPLDMGAGSRTQVLCRNSVVSLPLRVLATEAPNTVIPLVFLLALCEGSVLCCIQDLPKLPGFRMRGIWNRSSPDLQLESKI